MPELRKVRLPLAVLDVLSQQAVGVQALRHRWELFGGAALGVKRPLGFVGAKLLGPVGVALLDEVGQSQ